jgi:shikimate dehydrogenase
MKKLGLIGYPLTHSFSKGYFTEKFKKEGITDWVYELFPMPNLSDLPELLRSEPELCGLNVTIPHKIGVMYYLDKVEKAAKEIDAVNCIKIIKPNPVESFFSGDFSPMKVRLEGYNTDAYAFEKSLKPLLKKHHKDALILGNGGAARAVSYVLKKLKIDYKLVSRRPGKAELTYDKLNKKIISEHLIIINTTPAGTFPNITEHPEIPFEYITDKHLLYDLIYNPEVTTFLAEGQKRGATIKNGLEMLHLQAEKAWEIWNNKA